MNREFDKWFWEIEGYQVRSERFLDDVGNNRKDQIYKWLQVAFEAGYSLGKEHCGGTK